MGVGGYALIGIRIDPEKLFRKISVRNCNHDIDTNSKFCSECGVEVFKDDIEPIDGYDIVNETLGEFKLVWGTLKRYAYIGVSTLQSKMSSTLQENMVPVNDGDIYLVREKLKNALLPLGLWDDSEFGLWSVLCLNY